MATRYRLWIHIEEYYDGADPFKVGDAPKDITEEVFPDALPLGFFDTKEEAEAWARKHETDTGPKDCGDCSHPTCEGDCGITMPDECPRCKGSGDNLQHHPESIWCDACKRDVWGG